jgi:hypothetical protein
MYSASPVVLDGKTKIRVCGNMVQRKICGPDIKVITEGWRDLHNEEFHDTHFSPNIIKIIKLKIMRRTGHVARMGEMENTHTQPFLENLKVRDHFADIGVDRRILLKWL